MYISTLEVTEVTALTDKNVGKDNNEPWERYCISPINVVPLHSVIPM